MRMGRSRNLRQLGSFVFGLGLIIGSGLVNRPVKAQSVSSEGYLRSVLHRVLASEAHGRAVDRAEALQDTVTKDPTLLAYALSKSGKKPLDLNHAVHWHAGEVGLAQGWVPLNQLSMESVDYDVKSYYKLRPEGDFDAQAHRVMGRWCSTQGLLKQARAHWYGVLEFFPEDPEARKELGHEFLAGRWFSQEEIFQARSDAQAKMEACNKWMTRLQGIVASIEAGDTDRKRRGIDQLNKIDDPEFIHCLDIAIGQVSAPTALHLINAIGKFRTRQACICLASIALSDPTSKVGIAAIKQLSNYPPECYVPDLLDRMSTQIELKSRVVTRSNGELILQLVQMRELKNRYEQRQLDSLLAIGTVSRDRQIDNAITSPGSENLFLQLVSRRVLDDVYAARIVASEAQRLTKVVGENTQESNQNILAFQRRIATVLRGATGAELDDDAQSWWDWYDQYEESYSEGFKPVDGKYAEDRTQIVYRNAPRFTNPFSPFPSDRRPRRDDPDRDRRRHECLVKGTPVQTDFGLRPIETIKVGDLVACQDIVSGQLRFNAVLRATRRPEADVREIVLSNGESIQSTLGHRWWVIGQGWVKTKDLTQGTCLRTSTGFTSIQKMKDGLSEVTYNLVVDSDHTYFVGKSRLLSFDASEAIPTFQKVPGIQE